MRVDRAICGSEELVISGLAPSGESENMRYDGLIDRHIYDAYLT